MRREHTFIAKTRCLYPGCWRAEDARGNCHTHYNGYRAEIMASRTSWPKLEALGLARAKKPTMREVIESAERRVTA
jgi:hypothetical protein